MRVRILLCAKTSLVRSSSFWALGSGSDFLFHVLGKVRFREASDVVGARILEAGPGVFEDVAEVPGDKPNFLRFRGTVTWLAAVINPLGGRPSTSQSCGNKYDFGHGSPGHDSPEHHWDTYRPSSLILVSGLILASNASQSFLSHFRLSLNPSPTSPSS